MTPQEIQNLLNRLQDAYNRLGETNPFANFDTSNIQNAVATAAQLEAALRGVNQRILDARTGAEELRDAFSRSVDEIKNQSSAINQSTRALRGLQSIAQKLNYDQAGITKLSKKQLENLQEQAKQRQQDLEFSKRSLQEELLTATGDNAVRLSRALQVVEQETAAGAANYQALTDTIKFRIKQEKEINKLLGLGGNAIIGMKDALKEIGLGGLADRLGLEEAQEEMRRVAENINNSTTQTSKFGAQLKVLNAGVKVIGKNFVENLIDPTAILGSILSTTIQTFKDLMKDSEETARSMNMTVSEANQFRNELSQAAILSDDLYVNSKGLLETNMAINKALGTSVKLNDENVQAFTRLRTAAGLTNEELMGIQSLTLTNGKSLEANTGEIMAQARLTGNRFKVALNEKEVLKEINKVSAATTLSLGKDASAIANAVTTAKALGMELSKVDGIANSLLNFEESISNELEAELLLGKDINLEKARQAALNNDLATVAEEVAKQAGSAADFAKMNRIQQEAIAQAIGMNREDLAQSLFLQEQIGNVSAEEYELRKKQVEDLEAKGLSQAQIKEELAKTSIEDLEKQASIQTEFNLAVDKLKESFVQVATAVMPILEAVTGIVSALFSSREAAGALIGVLLGMKAISAFLALQTMIKAVAEIFAGNAKFGPVGLVASIAGVAGLMGAIGMATTRVSSAGDVMSPAKGKTMVSTREGGLYELSKNDDLVAAPGAVERMKNGGATTVINQTSPSDNTESKRTNMLLERIANQSPVFKIGTDEFFTSTSKYSYQVQ
jgi:broad specificity phosphatase PhoE